MVWAVQRLMVCVALSWCMLHVQAGMAAETKGQEAQDVEMGESGKGPEPVGQVRSIDTRITRTVKCCFDLTRGWQVVWQAKQWHNDGGTRSEDANQMLGTMERQRAHIMA